MADELLHMLTGHSKQHFELGRADASTQSGDAIRGDRSHSTKSARAPVALVIRRVVIVLGGVAAMFAVFLGMSSGAHAATTHHSRIRASCTAGRIAASTGSKGRLRVTHAGRQIGRERARRLKVRVPVGHVYRVALIRNGRSVAHVHVTCHRPPPKRLAPKPAPAPVHAAPVAKPAICSDASFGAHRGGDAAAVGDSDLAFERSYAAGARNEDTDISFTSDDQPIILHGPAFDGFGHPEALVADTPLAVAQTYTAADGGKVWTLPQFVSWLMAHPAVTLATTELKTTPTDAEYQTLITDLTPVQNRVVVVSFTGSDLPSMAQAGFRTGLIYSAAIATSPSKDVPLSTIGSYGSLTQVDLHNLSAALVTQLRGEGVTTIESWVNPGAAQYVRNPAGVIPLVDDVSGYLAWRRANC